MKEVSRAYVDDIRDALAAAGERASDEEIRWRVNRDYLYRIEDGQGNVHGAQTDDIYRSTDPDVSIELLGASFYLKLTGGGLDITEHEYAVWFELVSGAPSVTVSTDLQYWDPDPVYQRVEDVLEDYGIGVVFEESVDAGADDQAAA